MKVGARCCVFNYRGRGGVSLASPRTYCASDPSDLGEVKNLVMGLKYWITELHEVTFARCVRGKKSLQSLLFCSFGWIFTYLFLSLGYWSSFELKIWGYCACSESKMSVMCRPDRTFACLILHIWAGGNLPWRDHPRPLPGQGGRVCQGRGCTSRVRQNIKGQLLISSRHFLKSRLLNHTFFCHTRAGFCN